MGIHRVSPGPLGSQSFLASSPRQVGLHSEMIPQVPSPPKFKGRKSSASQMGGRGAVVWPPDCWSPGLGAGGPQTLFSLGTPAFTQGLDSPSFEEQ